MCIRDRVKAARRLQPAAVVEPALSPDLRGHRHLAAQVAEAVSYTHLRAHETVLDLVCRLLLEKKKEQHENVLILNRNPTSIRSGVL